MNVIGVIGLVIGFSGLCCNFAAGILYSPRIQRYLEAFGESPAFFGFSTSGLQDYWKAQKVATRSGQRPGFLKQYARLQIAAFGLFFVGAGLVLLAIILRSYEPHIG
jgi:hypothetical protein